MKRLKAESERYHLKSLPFGIIRNEEGRIKPGGLLNPVFD